MLARYLAVPEHLRMDAPEHRSALSVRDGDVDLDQTRCVDDDAIEFLAFPDKRHELTFVKGLHGPSVLASAAHGDGDTVDGVERKGQP